MFELITSDRHVVLLSDEDKDLVKTFSWHVRKTPKEYAATHTHGWLYMHHLILPNCPRGYVRDHINGNTLDNRRSNLRIVTQQENVVNSAGWGKHKRKYPSPYKGVWQISRAARNKTGRIWEAKIMVEGRQRYLGSFLTMEDAARAYDDAAKTFMPRTAYLNFQDRTRRTL